MKRQTVCNMKKLVVSSIVARWAENNRVIKNGFLPLSCDTVISSHPSNNRVLKVPSTFCSRRQSQTIGWYYFPWWPATSAPVVVHSHRYLIIQCCNPAISKFRTLHVRLLWNSCSEIDLLLLQMKVRWSNVAWNYKHFVGERWILTSQVQFWRHFKVLRNCFLYHKHASQWPKRPNALLNI